MIYFTNERSKNIFSVQTEIKIKLKGLYYV